MLNIAYMEMAKTVALRLMFRYQVGDDADDWYDRAVPVLIAYMTKFARDEEDAANYKRLMTLGPQVQEAYFQDMARKAVNLTTLHDITEIFGRC